MNSTAASVSSKWGQALQAIPFLIGLGCVDVAWSQNEEMKPMSTNEASATNFNLDAKQEHVVILAALAAVGDMPRLNATLELALDSGLTVSEVREVLIQLYAYAGFPRSLNALGQLMQVVNARKQRGIIDEQGSEPSRAIPQGDELLAAGTANQTKLVGARVEGPLFDFAPVANQYLRAHLFGDIFERDNLSWQMRELATVGMLSAIPGVESQLQAHMRISMNTGLTVEQLRQVSQILNSRADTAMGDRATKALEAHVETMPAS